VKNIVWHNLTITRDLRSKQNKHKSVVIWFTCLSGSGKSTLAHAVINAEGGEVVNYKTQAPLKYNTKDSLLNPHFIVQPKLFDFENSN